MSFLPYKIGALLLAIALVIGGAYSKGHHDATIASRAVELRAENKALSQKLLDLQAILDAANQRAESSAASLSSLQETIREYQDALAKHPSPSFALPDDDTRRLRDLARRVSKGTKPLRPSAARSAGPAR